MGKSFRRTVRKNTRERIHKSQHSRRRSGKTSRAKKSMKYKKKKGGAVALDQIVSPARARAVTPVVVGVIVATVAFIYWRYPEHREAIKNAFAFWRPIRIHEEGGRAAPPPRVWNVQETGGAVAKLM